MRKSLWILAFIVVFIGTTGAFAKTPDGKTPSEETVCDNETGAAFGLCNAYCEAMDCTDPNQKASNEGCEAVKRNFEKHTGRPLPCSVRCPCPGVQELIDDIKSGEAEVQRCIFDDNLLFVLTTAGVTALIEDGPPASCSVTDAGAFGELTPTEILVCRVALRKAVEDAGGQCIRPE